MVILHPLTSVETIDRARTLIMSGRGAVLQDLLELIQTLSNKVEELSLHELTDILEKDPIVVSRILSAANTVRSNPGITPLTSLSHAVHQVGFQKVRSIAVSMMLLESAAGATNCPEQRTAAAHALCAGLISRSCAASLGYADPDLLFACGTLRNLGAVLLPALAPEHCREVMLLSEKMPADAAYRSLFGLTPLELSREIVSSLRMPKEVIFAMDECYPETMASVATHQSGRILGITEFSSQLASLALSGKHSSASFLQQAKVLARRFHQTMPDAAGLIPAAINHANEQLTSLTRHGNFINPVVFSRIRAHAKLANQAPAENGVGAKVATAESLVVAPPEPASVAPVEPAGEVPMAPDPALEAEGGNTLDWAEQLAGTIAFESQSEVPTTDAGQSVEDPWMGVLATIQQMLEADQCAIFVGRPGDRRAALHRWTGVFGSGFSVNPVCTATERTVFGVCLMRHETVLIHDGFNPKLDNYLPGWIGTHANRPGAFMLLALTKEQPPGFVYLTWKKARKITISAAQTNLVRSLIAPHLNESALAAGA